MILRDAKAASYFYPRHYIKDIHLDFCAVPEPRSGLDVAATSIRVSADPDAPPAYDWRTLYTGHSLKRHDVRQELDIVRGIALEPDFVFVKSDDPDGPHAWLVHFWVPVPLALCIGRFCAMRRSSWAGTTLQRSSFWRRALRRGSRASSRTGSSRLLLGFGTDGQRRADLSYCRHRVAFMPLIIITLIL